MLTLSNRDPVAVALIQAIQGGDVATLKRLLEEDNGLASARIEDSKGRSRTPLHVVTDWPGYFPQGPHVAHMLLEAGADPNVPFIGGRHSETPLHWAASSDDVDVAEVLIDGGADVEASGAGIDGGPPLVNAVAFGCWHVARLLVRRGAHVDRLWQAAALGMMARVEELLARTPPPSDEEVNDAFWQACHGGQRRAAERLFALGADLNWNPHHNSATSLDVASGPDTRRQELASWLRGHGARSAEQAAGAVVSHEDERR